MLEIFKTLESFKSKYIIERQNSLLKKLQAENNIVKNENSQLKLNNGRLVARLRARYSLFLKNVFLILTTVTPLKSDWRRECPPVVQSLGRVYATMMTQLLRLRSARLVFFHHQNR